MPKPFPLPFNIGTDICSIPRILRILTQANARNFIRRILTIEEREHYQGRVELPLQKWQQTVRRREQIDRKRNDLGISHLELAHCYDFKKAGRPGSALMWLQQFRLQGKENAVKIKPEDHHKANIRDKSSTNVKTHRAEVSESPPNVDRTTNLAQDSAILSDIQSIDCPVHLMPMNGGIGPDDLDLLLRLIDENEANARVAKPGLRRVAEFIAGRFAAKEATIKAHHTQRLTYQRVCILPRPFMSSMPGSRPPVASVIPEGGKWEDGQEVRISISHDGDYATAVCLAGAPESEAKSGPPAGSSETNIQFHREGHIA